MDRDERNIGNNKWRILKSQRLGKGKFGTVFVGVEILTGLRVAIKEIYLGNKEEEKRGQIKEI